MGKKKKCIAMRIHRGETTAGDILNLPKGCIGLFFAFESKKAAREWWGKDVQLLEIEEKDE